jgi:hypothetical protein
MNTIQSEHQQWMEKVKEEVANARYFIYWNSHKKLFSVRYKGKVIGHHYMLALVNLKFKVNEQGRQRVLREHRKNVHAGVEAQIVKEYEKPKPGEPIRLVRYNPYRGPNFITDDGKPVLEAPRGICFEGQVWIW